MKHKTLKIKKITIVGTSDIDGVTFVEITTNKNHFYQCIEFIANYDIDAINFVKCHPIEEMVPSHFFNKEGFSAREQIIANYLFKFLWDSENGVNTFVDEEVYVGHGFSTEEMENFVVKFGGIGLEMDYEDTTPSINIMWDFLTHFNLNEWDPLEDISRR